jgi:hypothetical protein
MVSSLSGRLQSFTLLNSQIEALLDMISTVRREKRKFDGYVSVLEACIATSFKLALEALSAFLFKSYGELTNDENKTSVKEAWSLVSSIVRRMFDDIAVDRCLANFVDFKNEVKQH